MAKNNPRQVDTRKHARKAIQYKFLQSVSKLKLRQLRTMKKAIC